MFDFIVESRMAGVEVMPKSEAVVRWCGMYESKTLQHDWIKQNLGGQMSWYLPWLLWRLIQRLNCYGSNHFAWPHHIWQPALLASQGRHIFWGSDWQLGSWNPNQSWYLNTSSSLHLGQCVGNFMARGLVKNRVTNKKRHQAPWYLWDFTKYCCCLHCKTRSWWTYMAFSVFFKEKVDAEVEAYEDV